jgi:uncharacterized protein YfaS (alpha-2-macroglobulin family)
MHSARRRATLAALLAALLVACSNPMNESTQQSSPSPAPVPKPVFDPEPEEEGLKVRVSDADPSAAGSATIPRAETQPLEADYAAKLFARLPPLEEEKAPDFALRPASQPPPRTGETIDVPFPSPAELAPPVAEVDAGPLSVRRFAPEGDVPMAPHVSITFSKPMVAVTSQDEAAATIPATLDPQPPGSWRWLGTRTLLFDPDARMPMATTYTVTVPAGTAAADGSPLVEPSTFSFATPPVRIVRFSPGTGPLPLEPVFVLEFDQAIDVDASLPHVSLTTRGTGVPIRLATADEIAADAPAKAAVESARRPDRILALRAEAPLAPDTGYRITVAKGAPSAEGPRVTTAADMRSFHTFPPLKIVDSGCSYGHNCPPESDWWVRFNNPIAPAAVDKDIFTVEPEVRAFRVNHWAQTLNFGGIKTGRTKYTVTIPGGLRDIFSQTLGADRDLKFKVGPATKSLQGPSKTVVVLDPAADPILPVYSRSHKELRLRAYRVEPKDWPTMSNWMRRWWDHRGRRGSPPGRRVVDTSIRVQGDLEELTETSIDLSPYLDDGLGQLIVWVEPTVQPTERWNRQGFAVWVQGTRIGLSAAVDAQEMVAWASDLQRGSSLEGVEVAIEPGDIKGTTGPDGTARIELSKTAKGPQVLVARRGADLALLPQNLGWWNDTPGWVQREQADSLRWFVFDDRGLYKPGETARVKGWVRWFEPRRGGDIHGPDATQGPTTIHWELKGPQYNDIATGDAQVTDLGGFDIELELPPTINLGTAWLQLRADGGTRGNALGHQHALRIEEFRRPEFEVNASADPGPHILGGHAVIDVEAKYFAGGGLAAADTTWRLYAEAGSYTPPGRDEFTFGLWVPWWRRYDFNPRGGASTPIAEHSSKTDGGGVHRLRVDFQALSPARPMNVRAEATVMDVNRQAWTSRTTVLLHPADVYVGIKPARAFFERDRPVDVEVIAVNIDGSGASGRSVVVTLVRLAWETSGGRWTQVEKDVQECTLTSTGEPQSCSFQPEEGGSHRVDATVTDEFGRRNQTERMVWVSGGESKPTRGVEAQTVEMIPNQETFAPGDTAEILIQAPFHPAEALITVRRSGFEDVQRVRLETASHTLRIPIEDRHIPELTVQVDLIGETTRNDDQGRPIDGAPLRTAYATGSLQLKISPITRTLSVEVTPAASEVAPGAETSIDLTLLDATGAPVSGAEVALVVVDEAVLSLTGYTLADPLELFYAARGAGVSDHRLRAFVLLANPLSLSIDGDGHGDAAPEEALMLAMEPMAEAAPVSTSAGGQPPSPVRPRRAANRGADDANGRFGGAEQDKVEGAIALRTEFGALALFEPALATDAAGKARVKFTVPDSLTRYRVMVVAVSGGKAFGKGEATITARKPLMIRPSPPRFLNFGDRFELPVIIQNQTPEPLAVRIAMRSTGFVPTGGPGYRLRVAPHDRVEVRFPAAVETVGTGRFQIVAEAVGPKNSAYEGAFNDAAQQELPIWTPATSEAFATYGSIGGTASAAIAQPVSAPGDVWTQFGGLEITTSSTAVQALTDAVIHLVDYPFECSEQLASRILAIAALRDVLAAFDADGLPDSEALVAKVESDIEVLTTRQRGDGGFGFWRKNEPHRWPYLTVHVMHSLARAKTKGFDVPKEMWMRGARYLVEVKKHIPATYSKESGWAIRAYAVYVRRLMGNAGAQATARTLYREAGDGLSLEALAWILPSLKAAGAADSVASILLRFDNAAVETAAHAQFTTSYSDGAHVLLHSARRTDGIVLEAMIEVSPDSDLIEKVAKGLLAHRRRGRWSSTQDNAFILLALDRYFREYEAETPDFVARAWLGDDYAGEHSFVGRTTERARTAIPMAALAERGPQTLVLQKDGVGRMYYRIGLKYAPKSLDLAPADYGFAVERTYLPVDDDGDVTRDDDGTWRVKAGARVRVKVTMVAPARRYHVALVDPLPAGFEAINPELATSETLPPADEVSSEFGGRGRYWWWWGPWYEHDNLRDERAEAFTSLLWDGVHEYTYLARATTPGVFVVPPPKAEEMYHPETFGRGATARVVIE